MSKKLLTLMGVLFGFFAGLLKILQEKWNLTLFLFHLSSTEIISLSLVISALCFGMFVFSYRKIFVSVISGTLLLLFIIVCLFSGFITEAKYYTFQSPDQKHTLIIEEEAFLLAGYGSFYLKENALFMKKMKDYTTDDGYRPFQQDDAHLEWQEDRVTIKYGYGNGERNEAVIVFE